MCLLFPGCFVTGLSVWYVYLGVLCVFFFCLDNIFTPVTYVYIQIQLEQFFSLTCSWPLLFSVGSPRSNDAGLISPKGRKELKLPINQIADQISVSYSQCQSGRQLT